MDYLHISEVFPVIGTIADDPNEEGYVIKFDAIEWRDAVWLVPSWLESRDGLHRLPERIVGLPASALVPSTDPDIARFLLRDPVPRPVLEGRALSQSEYTVVERPDIRVQTSSN